MSHVPSQPWRIPIPGGMISRDSGLLHNTRNSMGTSGNFLEDLLAPEGPSPSFFKIPRNFTPSLCELMSGSTGSTMRHGEGLRREPQSSTTPTPRFTRNHETWNPLYHTGGTYSQNCFMDTISELHFGKFPDSGDFQFWRVNFKTEMCVGVHRSLDSQCRGAMNGDGKIHRRSYDVAIN